MTMTTEAERAFNDARDQIRAALPVWAFERSSGPTPAHPNNLERVDWKWTTVHGEWLVRLQPDVITANGAQSFSICHATSGRGPEVVLAALRSLQAIPPAPINPFDQRDELMGMGED